MCQNLVTALQLHPKHRAREDGGNLTVNLHRLFFVISLVSAFAGTVTIAATTGWAASFIV